MNTKDWKQNELNRLLMEKFNLSVPSLEEEVEVDESHCGGNRDEEELEEELTGGQKEIDADKDGEITADDFEMLRNKKA
tara:strand:+ start:82 stop:318 length:237 start_codon:yes stop_codon:yes gene_type:complete